MEAQLATPCGHGRYVIVAGHAIEMPGPGGIEPCMLFTFADLEDRRKAEMALRHSEERFAKAFDLSPVPSALMDADGLEITSVNRAFVTTFGHAPRRGRPVTRRPFALGRPSRATQVLPRLEAAWHASETSRPCSRMQRGPRSTALSRPSG